MSKKLSIKQLKHLKKKKNKKIDSGDFDILQKIRNYRKEKK